MFHPSRLANWNGVGEALEIVLNDLECWAPRGVDSRRSTFRNQRNNERALLDLRSELVVAASLARNRVKFEFLRGSPDLVCETIDGRVGVEVTTRHRNDIRTLHDALEARPINANGVQVQLRRIGTEYKFDQRRLSEIVEVVAQVAESGRSETVSFAWAGVAATVIQDEGSGSGMQVMWDARTDWNSHWLGIGWELVSSIKDKGTKNYSVPTIAVVDITRLGDSSHWPPSEIPKNLTQRLTEDMAGSLEGVVVVFSGFLQSASVTILERWTNPAKTNGAELTAWFERACQPALALKMQQAVNRP